MNLLFFLTLKSEVVTVREDNTLDKVLSKMEGSRYSTIPVINKAGCYKGTLTEGDLLWAMKNDPEITFENASKIKLKRIERKRVYHPVNVNAKMDELLELALTQNFVPVIDDSDIFIGIVTRRDIMNYYRNEQKKQMKEAEHA